MMFCRPFQLGRLAGRPVCGLSPPHVNAGEPLDRASDEGDPASASGVHIQRVTVHGFKSYKESVTIQLSPQCGVGDDRNGDGESFAAIRFVLGGIFRAEEMPARKIAHRWPRHAGAGGAAMTAFVELVFDNSDSRFPVRAPTENSPRAPLLSRFCGRARQQFARRAGSNTAPRPSPHARALAVLCRSTARRLCSAARSA